jgi:hypothetical protein
MVERSQTKRLTSKPAADNKIMSDERWKESKT